MYWAYILPVILFVALVVISNWVSIKEGMCNIMSNSRVYVDHLEERGAYITPKIKQRINSIRRTLENKAQWEYDVIVNKNKEHPYRDGYYAEFTEAQFELTKPPFNGERRFSAAEAGTYSPISGLYGTDQTYSQRETINPRITAVEPSPCLQYSFVEQLKS